MRSADPPFSTFLRKLDRGLLWGSVLFAVYVLSIGPALLLNKRGIISAELLEMVFIPASFVCDVPGGKWLLDRYLGLWVSPDP